MSIPFYSWMADTDIDDLGISFLMIQMKDPSDTATIDLMEIDFRLACPSCNVKITSQEKD